MLRTSNRWLVVGATLITLLFVWSTVAAAQDVRPRVLPPVWHPERLVAEVISIQPLGPAYRAGLEVGDRILEVNGDRVTSLTELHSLLHNAGYSARLTVLDVRSGNESTIWVYPVNGHIGINARMVNRPTYPPPYPY